MTGIAPFSSQRSKIDCSIFQFAAKKTAQLLCSQASIETIATSSIIDASFKYTSPSADCTKIVRLQVSAKTGLQLLEADLNKWIDQSLLKEL